MRFGNASRLGLYCYPLFENEFFSRTEEDKQKVFEKMKEVEDVMADCNFFYGDALPSFIRLNHCMVDNAKAVVISPEGNLGLCEHNGDSDFMGHVDEPDNLDFDIIKSWRVYEKDLDICSDCPLYPNCVRASKCEEQSRCNEHYKNWHLKKMRQGMRLTYFNILNSRNNYIKN
jgi:radical SAM protein with 4Fe4S-binding SPASM domain